MRKTYISPLTPRRAFARIQPRTKQRVELGLRRAGPQPGRHLQPSKIHETMPLQISLTSLDDVLGVRRQPNHWSRGGRLRLWCGVEGATAVELPTPHPPTSLLS